MLDKYIKQRVSSVTLLHDECHIFPVNKNYNQDFFSL